VTQDKVQLSGNVVHIDSHVGDEYLEGDNEGAELADRMSHSGGLKGIETTLAYLEKWREVTTAVVNRCAAIQALV
jgi:hypothetical protein